MSVYCVFMVDAINMGSLIAVFVSPQLAYGFAVRAEIAAHVSHDDEPTPESSAYVALRDLRWTRLDDFEREWRARRDAYTRGVGPQCGVVEYPLGDGAFMDECINV